MPDTAPRKVLLVDDDAAVREALSQTLELADLDPLTAGSFVEAKDHIRTDFPGVVLSDIRMPGRDGFFLLDHAHAVDPDLPVILLTGEGDIPMAVSAMDRGAFGFLEKPCASRDMLTVLEKALHTRQLILENRRLKAQLEAGDPAARLIFGTSQASHALRDAVRQAGRTSTEVLISGAPGTGISKIAEVIHLTSGQSKGPFLKRAAAGMDRAGLDRAWEACQGGSFFLDEIGNLTEDAQLALGDALEKGGARLIGGTTRDPAELVASGDLSAEIYYRLEVCHVHIPSLAERPGDIPVLFRHYVAQAAEQAGIEPPEITAEHENALMAQDWPGNARSLMSAAMRFVLGMPEEASTARDLGLAEQMAQIERSLLAAALGRHNGRASEAAKALKLPRKTLYDKLAKYGLKPDDFRRGGG
ncbi:C4-dicarboxylate transport transcriptional regulatory protein [Pseudooceanicola batsensis HTCC2597]|uniref:C4-dicarboxylate transport transcriptional regulatory protein n=1 Tax=Pseudooceanicola batsensis (strain ATCC BAA-863 / DSM 15984 / KCTC 12145 / HTCC2597) TaxID=252305 RepID=A3U230_PSEBH|nr:sigma-54 dependent transcriptional regulator [Pseudooceanicola batsensis]EAQ01964.1 C4-dicarboxylate transport transcriptional regulatory protein [Pseudooceanicola batsensis HTCC2597]